MTGLAAVFAGMTAVLAIAGIIYNPFILGVAAVFAVVTYVLWSHATGRLAASIYRQVEQQAATSNGQQSAERGGFGAGPREEWRGPGGGERSRRQRAREQRQRERAQRQRARHRRGGRDQQRRQRRAERGRQRSGRQRQRPPQQDQKMSAEEAYRTLDLRPGADESTVKSAYREKVKKVHPDTDGGDEERFKKVQTAYERLTQ